MKSILLLALFVAAASAGRGKGKGKGKEGVDCQWDSFGPWGECSASCGKGFQQRRKEIRQMAQNGGAPCTGSGTESRNCDLPPCSDHPGGWPIGDKHVAVEASAVLGQDVEDAIGQLQELTKTLEGIEDATKMLKRVISDNVCIHGCDK